jgi:hypothetical protein
MYILLLVYLRHLLLLIYIIPFLIIYVPVSPLRCENIAAVLKF